MKTAPDSAAGESGRPRRRAQEDVLRVGGGRGRRVGACRLHRHPVVFRRVSEAPGDPVRLDARRHLGGDVALYRGSGDSGHNHGSVHRQVQHGVCLAIGSVAGAASYLFLSRLDSLWEFYLGFGVGAGICSGCAFTPITATVSKWFDESKRTLALGIALTGVMIGQMILSPVMNHVIQGGDWRLGYVVSAIVVVACGVPGAVIMSRRPPDIGRQIVRSAAGSHHAGGPGGFPGYTVREAAKTPPFWMIIITAFAISCGFYIFMSQIVAHARDVSVQPGVAALILTVSGVGSLGGSLLAHWYTQKMGGQRTLFIVLLLQALAMFLFTVTASAWSFFVVAALFGFTYGTAAPVRMGLIPPLFGLKCIGSMLGCTTFAWSIGGLVGPTVAGYIHDATDKYVWAFVASGVVYILGALSVWFWGSHKQDQTGTS